MELRDDKYKFLYIEIEEAAKKMITQYLGRELFYSEETNVRKKIIELLDVVMELFPPKEIPTNGAADPNSL